MCPAVGRTGAGGKQRFIPLLAPGALLFLPIIMFFQFNRYVAKQQFVFNLIVLWPERWKKKKKKSCVMSWKGFELFHFLRL